MNLRKLLPIASVAGKVTGADHYAVWNTDSSDRGGECAAIIYSMIFTAKMDDVDPQAWLADLLVRIAEHPVQKTRRTSAMELACVQRAGQSGGLTMAGISHFFTIALPCGLAEDGTTAFTPFGVDNLAELVQIWPI
jgi:hypothetical protein